MKRKLPIIAYGVPKLRTGPRKPEYLSKIGSGSGNGRFVFFLDGKKTNKTVTGTFAIFRFYLILAIFHASKNPSFFLFCFRNQTLTQKFPERSPRKQQKIFSSQQRKWK